MNRRERLIKTLTDAGVEIEEVTTEIGPALRLVTDDNKDKPYDTYAFIDTYSFHLRVSSKNPVDQRMIEDLEHFMRKNFQKDWRITPLGFYYTISWHPYRDIRNFARINVRLLALIHEMDRCHRYVDAIVNGKKTYDQAKADFDLYVVKIFDF